MADSCLKLSPCSAGRQHVHEANNERVPPPPSPPNCRFVPFLSLHQVGSGSRSEKIRTYNWKDSRCSDHRIGKNFPLNHFLSGSGLDDMIGACILLDQQELMAEMAAKQRQGQEGAAAGGR